MFRGTIIAQIIAILVGFYLAKLYGKEAYGFLGFFVSIMNIASIIGTLQLDNCIIISKNKNESINWFNFILIIILPITLFIFFVLFVFSKFILIERLDTYMFLFCFFGSAIITYNLAHQRFFTFQKKFSVISNIKIFITICAVILQFILFEYYKLFGLIIGFLMAQIILLLYNFYKNKSNLNKVNFNEIKKGIILNKSLVTFLLPSNIINSLANNLMPILILAFFGAEKAGVYFFSIKILATPLFLISSSVSEVYYQKSSELKSENKIELLTVTKKIIKSNLLIMVLFLLIINTLGIYILDVFFENQWEYLKTYILILSFLILARSSFNPISSLIVVLDKNLIGLIFNCYLFIINLIAIYFGVLYSNILYTVFILSLFGGIGYYILLYYFLNHLKRNQLNV